ETGGARLWEVPTGKPRGAPLTQEETWAVAFSPDGQRLLTGGGNEAPQARGRAQLWFTRTGQSDGPGLTLDSAVRAVAFSPDSHGFVAVASSGAIQVVTRATGRGYGTKHPPFVRRAGFSDPGHFRVNALAMSPDGRTFVTAGADAQAFDLHDGSTVGT